MNNLRTGVARAILTLLVWAAWGGGAAAIGPVCDVAGADADAVAKLRRTIEDECPCHGYSSHGEFLTCVTGQVALQVQTATISKACGSLVRKVLRNSTCSYPGPRVACCTETASGARRCRPRRPDQCESSGAIVRTVCTDFPVCADTVCGRSEWGLPSPVCSEELVAVAEGNRLRRYDVDSIDSPPLVDDVWIERAALDPVNGRDVNGQVCHLPDGSGRFIMGEDTGQPYPPTGWGVFTASGAQVGKLTTTYFTAGAEPFGCAFAPDGSLFTSEIGSQSFGTSNGQLIQWFPPYDHFPGPPSAYPATSAPSTNFCKIATNIGTAGAVAVDAQGRVYVTSASEGRVWRFLPPFPTGPTPADGCDGVDALGSPMATWVQREEEPFIGTPGTWTGLTRGPNGNWYAASILEGKISEFDANGVFLRTVMEPAAGESTFPMSVGHPMGLATDCRGDLYYADLALQFLGPGVFGPGPNATARRITFDMCAAPSVPQTISAGLQYPDGIVIVPGNLSP